MKKLCLFTSESVTEGHPDRLCDTVSDAILDRILRQDPYSRVVTECALSKNVLFIAARLATLATVDLPEIARNSISQINFRPEDFNAEECSVITSLIPMPNEHRAIGDEMEMSDAELDTITVRNQVTLFGYACDHTPELMPLPIVLANRISRNLASVRRQGIVTGLSPDCTTQVGVDFDGRKPQSIHSITLIAGAEDPEAGSRSHEEWKQLLMEQVVTPTLHESMVKTTKKTEIFVNPQGIYPKSGPASHSGMTGRKTASDSYGGYSRHSSSALSGKDPLRIDRSGAYAARYAAKNVVASGLAQECEIQLSYSIGHAGPISIRVNTFGTGKLADHEIESRLEKWFDFRLGAIIKTFRLRHLPTEHRGRFYGQLPTGGHFDHATLVLPWEKTDDSARLSSMG